MGFLDAHDNDSRRLGISVIAAVETAFTFFNRAAAVHWADTSDLHVDNEHSFPRCAIGAAATGLRPASEWAAQSKSPYS